MLSYTPEGLEPGAPLVVVLHGCTQRAEAHAEAGGWLTLADRHGFAVLAPEQTPANNPNRCFNWYETEDAGRGRGEAASVRAMVAHAVREHGLDAGRVFVTGLSAGGAMTSVMLAAYPDVFAAGAIVAGLPFGVADNLQAALGAMYAGRAWSAADLGDLVRGAAPAGGRVPRVSIWHGDADATVRPHNAVEIAKQWTSAHGLRAEPDEMQTLPGRTRALWRSPGGEVLVESNLIQGLGHGTPLQTSGPDGVGTAAPYMLEAGVSSSLEIARFWGIAPAGEATRAADASTQSKPQPKRRPEPEQPRASSPPLPDGAAIGEQVMATVSRHVPPGVQDVISKALKTAGLLK
jgi:poly(hydroxyalkanoate) depolymerase family esterase